MIEKKKKSAASVTSLQTCLYEGTERSIYRHLTTIKPQIYLDLQQSISRSERNLYSVTVRHYKRYHIRQEDPSRCKIWNIDTSMDSRKEKPDNPSKHKVISVTPLILKVPEQIISYRYELLFLEAQSDLQHGFTKKRKRCSFSRNTFT